MNNKKSAIIIIVLIAIIVALVVVCFRTCRKKNAPDDAEGANQAQTDIYVKLNSLLNGIGYPVILTVKTTEGENVFNGSYTITEHGDVRAASYSYEKLNTFEIRDDEVVIPEDFKTTCSGQIKTKNRKIIEQNGAALNLSVEALDVKGFSLTESALTNVKTERGIFSADITSLKTVAGIDLAANDAKISIAYTDAKIMTIVLSYSTTSHHTEMTYRFG